MKKVIAFLLIAVLVIGCVSCTGGNTSSQPAESSKPAESKAPSDSSTAPESSKADPEPADPYAAGDFSYPMEKYTLSINKDAVDYSTIPSWVGEYYWETVVEEKTGVSLEMIGSPSSPREDTEAFNLLLVSGVLPDLLQCNWLTHKGGPEGAIADGYIYELSQFKQYFPAYYQILQDNPDTYKKWVSMDDGGLYNFPSIVLASPTGTGWSIREDYLERIGEKVPSTVDQWHTVLTKFKEELGLSAPITFEWRWLFLEYAAAGLSNPWSTCYPFYIMDGQVVFGPTTEGYKQFVDTMRQWYAEGLIDPDILSVDKKTVESKVSSGDAGIGLQQIRNTQNCMIADHSDDPTYKLVGLPGMVMNEGDPIEFGHYTNAYEGSICISISTQCTNVPLACRYLDWGYTEEGHMIMEYGTEGFSYDMVDGKPVLRDIIKNNPDTPDAQAARYYVGYFRNHAVICDDAYAHFSQDVLDIAEKFGSNQQAHAIPTVSFTDEENEAKRDFTDIDTASREAIANFVMGNRDMSEWDAFQAEINGMGLPGVTAAYQSAYDRYNSR